MAHEKFVQIQQVGERVPSELLCEDLVTRVCDNLNCILCDRSTLLNLILLSSLKSFQTKYFYFLIFRVLPVTLSCLRR